jgi:hypothetical protein
VSIIVAIAVRPVIGDGEDAVLFFSVALGVTMLAGAYATGIDELVGGRARLLRERRWRGLVALALACVAIAERLLTFLVAPTPHRSAVAAASWLLFFGFVTWNGVRNLLRQRNITGETISLSISIYLLLAFTWGILYFLLHQLHAENFHFAEPPRDPHNLLPVFVYFSLTTISTTGFGDVVPLSLQARYLAATEGITGQFYLAVLVARLVGMQMSQSKPPPG